MSVYNFRQSVKDGATVPLFYENRTPELQITNPELNEEIYQTIDDAGLDEDQEEKLRNVLGQRYHLITRDDRLDAVAKDIVHHFLNRGYQGKAMVVSIDKVTTLRMYEKVRAEWEAEKGRTLKALKGMAPGHSDYERLNARLVNLQETDMAVVVSPGQNEISEMEEMGCTILPHRERMVREDLADKFKNPDDKFRLVFVCAMWLTGFDVPSCSTLYLDKPMRGHTPIQTIARANRVDGDKVNGLIMDYANVFQELEKSLAIYGTGTGSGEMPVKDKQELVAALRIALDQVFEFCRKQNVDLIAVHKFAKDFIPAVNQLLRTDAVRDSFLGQANDIARLYKAVMPDPVIPELAPTAQWIAELVTFTKELNAEEQRHLREQISEEELAVFDILTRPGPELTPQEVESIKKVCKDLLAKLKTEKLVHAWRTKRTTRAAVRVEIEKMLDSGLPEESTTERFEQKCGLLFQHVLEKYPDQGTRVYSEAG